MCSNKIDVTIDQENIRKELMRLPKETLVDLVDAACKDAWTCQNYWMVFTERRFGTQVAVDGDAEVFSNVVKAQYYRVRKIFKLGDDIRSLAKAIKFIPVQWPSAGFEYKFLKLSNKGFEMLITQCPMGSERRKSGLPYLPCKKAGIAIYESLTKLANPKMSVKCIFCPPDETPEGVMCKWEFRL